MYILKQTHLSHMSQQYVMNTKYSRVAKGMAMFNDVNCYVTKLVNMQQQNKIANINIIVRAGN